MRRHLLAAGVIGIALAAAPRGHAQDDVKSIIEKAIKAHGGAEALAKTKATRSTSKGTVYLMGQPLAFTEKTTIQQPDKFKSELTLEIMGQQIQIVVVYDGKTCWAKGPQGVMEDPPTAAGEIKGALHAARAAMLTGLLDDKAFKVAPLGESKVKGKAALGVKVSHKDQKDVDFYFDKESSLLVKVARPVLDQAGEVMEERFLSDYKDFDGLKRPTKIVAERGGMKHLEAELVEAKTVDKIDSNEFAKP
jgi:uncharacterized protein YifN (PemK superfamily)